jgi:hypothetical protein
MHDRIIKEEKEVLLRLFKELGIQADIKVEG